MTSPKNKITVNAGYASGVSCIRLILQCVATIETRKIDYEWILVCLIFIIENLRSESRGIIST
jgi:hypothetical protein